ncbi:hypothetical protein B7494_g2591 [Chlorociboria aeruginascens]|nr:hypothetical protein B7494_g2591 [Chlorociboria aeruginascens]
MVRLLELLISTFAFRHFANGSGNPSSNSSSPANYFLDLCAGQYFDLTAANREQSQSADFYGRWEYNAYINDKEMYREKGETSLFISQFLDVDFSCTSLEECSPAPTCPEVTENVFRSNDAQPEHDKLDLARKVYFSLNDIESMASALTSIDHALKLVRKFLDGRSGKVMNDAVIKANKKGELICDITRFAIDFAINFALTAAPSSLEESYIKLAWKAAKASIDSADSGLEYTSFHHRDSPSLPDYGNGVPQSVCNDLKNIAKAKHMDKTKSLLKHIDNVFGKIRAHLWKVSLGLMQGAFAVEENMLDPFIRTAIWMKEAQRKDAVESVKNHTSHQQLAEKQFMGYITPAAMWNTACYLKCETGLQSKMLCNDDGPHQDERYCPDNRTSCQEQCWTNTKYNNYEITLHGKDKLAGYGLSPQEVAESSFENYINNGFQFNVTQVLDNPDFDETSANTLSLPVCMSRMTKITDFEPEAQYFDYHPHLNTQFPCVCGNWMANETRLFMDQIEMGIDGRSESTRQTFTEICPRNLDGMWPLNHFLAFCELDIHWPYIGELIAIQPGANKRICEKVKQKIIEENLEHNEGQANWRFCSRRWPVAEELLDRELDSAFMVWGKLPSVAKTLTDYFSPVAGPKVVVAPLDPVVELVKPVQDPVGKPESGAGDLSFAAAGLSNPETPISIS